LQEDEGDNQFQEPETASMQVTAEFDEIVVWGHEAEGNAHEDPFIRSVEEWLDLAEKVTMNGS
jgi:ribonuclease H2 subunit C